MTKKRAMKEATEIAKRDGIRMVVTWDPYAENPVASENYGYFPKRAAGIFNLEEIVETIEPEEVDEDAAELQRRI